MSRTKPFMSKIFRSKKKVPEKAFTCRIPEPIHAKAELLAEYRGALDEVKWSLSDVAEQAIDWAYAEEARTPEMKEWLAARQSPDLMKKWLAKRQKEEAAKVPAAADTALAREEKERGRK